MKKYIKSFLILFLIFTLGSQISYGQSQISIELESNLGYLKTGKIVRLPVKVEDLNKKADSLSLEIYNNQGKVVKRTVIKSLTGFKNPEFRTKVSRDTSKLRIVALDKSGKEISNSLNLHTENLGITNRREKIIEVLDYEEYVDLNAPAYIPEWINVRTNLGKIRKVAVENPKSLDTSKAGSFDYEIKIPNSKLTGKYSLHIEELNQINDKDPIEFKDKNLEKAVRALIGKSKGEILKEDVKNIKTFAPISFNVFEIKDISGLEHFEALEVLDLDYMEVSDISPVKNLKNLKWLYLAGNPLNSIEKGTFRNLKKLEQLGLENCGLRKIERGDFKGLDNLHYIDLNMNDLTDIEGLVDLPSLTSLHLDENRISNLETIGKLKNLEILWIDGNGLVDPSPLYSLENLKWLRINRNFITDLDGIQSLSKLEKLEFKQNMVEKLPDLSEMENLVEIKGSRNQLKDLSGLDGLKRLESIEFDNNHIHDISALENIKTMRKIDLKNNQIEDLSPLRELRNLSHLWLTNNKIKDIDGLENLVKLQLLMIKEGNMINDFSKTIPYYFNLKHKDFTL